jgi:hypothetical protein
MEKSAFTRMSLSDVGVIVAIMCILVKELLCQEMTGRIPVLECLLSGPRGRIWLRPVMIDIKWRYFPRTQL